LLIRDSRIFIYLRYLSCWMTKNRILESKHLKSSQNFWISWLQKILKMSLSKKCSKLLRLIMRKFNCAWQKSLGKLYSSFSPTIFIWNIRSLYLSSTKWWSAIKKLKWDVKQFLIFHVFTHYIRTRIFKMNMI
jgi:hypothetical protein